MRPIHRAISAISGSREAPGSDGGSAHPDTAGDEGLLRVVGDGVLVDGDVYLVQPVLILLAGEAEVPGVHQHQMVVRAAGDQPEALLDQALPPEPRRFCTTCCLVGLELRLQRLAQAHGLGGDDVLQRAALGAGEDGLVDLLVQLVVVGTGSCRPGDPAGSCGWWWSPRRHRGWGRDEPRRPPDPAMWAMSTIRQAPTSSAISRNGLKVDGAGIGAGPGHDQLGPALLGDVRAAAS